MAAEIHSLTKEFRHEADADHSGGLLTEPHMSEALQRRRHQKGADPRGQIPHLPAEVGHRHLRASSALEMQRLHQQGHR